MTVLAVGPLSLATASAQTTSSAQAVRTGSVIGSVADPQGAPVAGAAVRMTGQSTYKATTDAKGSFTITNVDAAFYTVTVEKPGYDPAHQADLAVLAGETETVSVMLQPVSFSSLREIASVRVRSIGSRFNATTASSQIVTAQDYAQQGQVQVQRVLDQTPGIVIDHPGTSANNSSAGAITFPSIRGGLGFETASFIDGHPLSVGKYGDYVTTFLSPWVLQSTELVKGPGSMPDEIAYAINGTANFRTKDPTLHPTGTYTVGYSKNMGSFGNAGYSNTFGKLGLLFDYAVDSYYGPLVNASQFWNLPSSATVNGSAKSVGFTTNAPPDSSLANSPFNYSGQLVACCFQVSDVFVSKTELAKLRYKFSDATTFMASYLGSQTWTDQNGNHVMGINQLFAPCGLNGYAANQCATASNQYGPFQTGTHVFTWQNIFPPQGEWEVNNEPMLQGELHTTLGRDTLLARYYTASINRLQYNALDSPAQSFTGNYALY
ncbi:MAG: carboxypeptidase regulatory-like domain-containing protein, partial [Candidatus Eremiobacteraeota bacterium]|nr:carboxypeptidase regulatory-like domain-containing protein [Candidatus Eremiobacteraeota bacterium]